MTFMSHFTIKKSSSRFESSFENKDHSNVPKWITPLITLFVQSKNKEWYLVLKKSLQKMSFLSLWYSKSSYETPLTSDLANDLSQ